MFLLCLFSLKLFLFYTYVYISASFWGYSNFDHICNIEMRNFVTLANNLCTHVVCHVTGHTSVRCLLLAYAQRRSASAGADRQSQGDFPFYFFYMHFHTFQYSLASSQYLYIRTSPLLAPFMVCADTVCSCNLVSSLGDIGNMLPYKHAN